jgi:hypothetical protein
MMSKYKAAASQSLEAFSTLIEAEAIVFEQSLMQLHKKIEALQLMIETPDCMSQIVNGISSETCLPAECIVTMTGLPPYMSNVYPCEFTSSNVPYRWTGPDTKTKFYVWIDRSEERSLVIEVLSAIQPSVLDEVVVLIDGQPVRYDRPSEGIAATLNVREGKPFVTEICLTVPRNYMPSEVNGSADNRPLGLALSRLIIK